MGGTRIFARPHANGEQTLIYAMQLQLDEALAMVLPIPTPPRAPEDAVTFVDLSGYPRFFDDLARAFPPAFLQAKRGGPLAAAAPALKRLAVHRVGDFEASFVPSVTDFARLDDRFRLPSSFWAAVPTYADWGFVVVKLAPRRRFWQLFGARQTIHPLALTFPRRDPTLLYFPTLHVHDGIVHPKAHFDHELYCQPDAVVARLLGWTAALHPIGQSLDFTRSRGLVDEKVNVFRNVLVGELDNRDIALRTPVGVDIEDLSGRGRTYRYDVRAAGAVHASLDRSDYARAARFAKLCRALREGLAELERDQAGTFGLTELTDTLPPHCLNGPDLWSGRNVFEGSRAAPGGPGSLEIWVDAPPHETQWITFGFASLPDQTGIVRLQNALRAIIAPAGRVADLSDGC